MDKEIKISGELIKNLLEKHFNKKLKVTLVELNNDFESVKNINDFNIFLEEI